MYKERSRARPDTKAFIDYVQHSKSGLCWLDNTETTFISVEVENYICKWIKSCFVCFLSVFTNMEKLEEGFQVSQSSQCFSLYMLLFWSHAMLHDNWKLNEFIYICIAKREWCTLFKCICDCQSLSWKRSYHFLFCIFRVIQCVVKNSRL